MAIKCIGCNQKALILAAIAGLSVTPLMAYPAVASTILLQADFNDLETPTTSNPRTRFSTIEGAGISLGDSGFTILSGSVNALDETFELFPNQPIAPGQGKIVDVAGEPPEGGAIQSDTFAFSEGEIFELQFKLFAWQDSFFGEEASLRVTFGDLFDETVTLRFDDAPQMLTRTFEANTNGEAAVIFDPRNLGNPRVDVAPFIDDVTLRVASVPEPFTVSNWALLSWLGLLSWKRRKK
ncbi:MAG: hypothetical protein ACFBSF_20490 [Leptolyngbyaceae cyanobacterium]